MLYGLLGWGTYNYGEIRFRFLMEYGKQFITYWFIYAIARSISQARRARDRELRAAQLEKELSEARLSALRMQLNPHFLFNTLNTIASYVYEDAPTAEQMIVRLSDLLRRTLSQSGRPEVPLWEELELLDSYVSIMKIRFQEKLQISTEGVDPGSKECLVPFLILQPMVENSIRLCTADVDRTGVVRVSAGRRAGDLELIVEDNGPGIAGPVDRRPGGGVGLSNTKSRLEHLYGDRHRLEMLNLPEGGLRITIRIPARHAQPEQEIHQCPSAS
jgi:LytS/YehU family sensor histidine kinase